MPAPLTPEQRTQRAKDIGLLYDDEDRHIIEDNTFYLGNDGYARTNGRTGSLLMHRIIMGDPPFDGAVIDHINGNRNDNRRHNLRWTTNGENVRRACHSDMSHISVREWQHETTYQVRIKREGNYVMSKSYGTIEEAIAARDAVMHTMQFFGHIHEKEPSLD